MLLVYVFNICILLLFLVDCMQEKAAHTMDVGAPWVHLCLTDSEWLSKKYLCKKFVSEHLDATFFILFLSSEFLLFTGSLCTVLI